MYDYNLKIAKFGGSSLADAGQITKVKSIVLADPLGGMSFPPLPERDLKTTLK